MFRHLAGCVVMAARWLMRMVDELLASTASAGAMPSSSLKIALFTSRSSNTASITQPASRSRRVVIDRHPEQPDLQVAQVHDRFGLGANRDVPLWLEAVVDDQRAALELEGHSLVDVGDPDPDPRLELIEIFALGGAILDVCVDQPPEHRRARARFLVCKRD